MLLIEGPDLVGKTTLCHAILKNPVVAATPAIYGHFSRLPKSWNYYHNYLPFIQRWLVMDRFHLSELAYGPINHGRSYIDHHRLMMINAHLDLVGSYTVVITATEDFITDQWRKKDRGEMFTLEQVLDVNNRYRTMLSNSIITADVELVMQQGEKFIAERQSIVDGIASDWISRAYLTETICKG